jgi:hypothetical protein
MKTFLEYFAIIMVVSLIVGMLFGHLCINEDRED